MARTIHRSRQGWLLLAWPDGLPDERVVSFKDMQGKRQSGCQRVVSELAARGEIDTEAARPYLTE